MKLLLDIGTKAKDLEMAILSTKMDKFSIQGQEPIRKSIYLMKMLKATHLCDFNNKAFKFIIFNQV